MNKADLINTIASKSGLNKKNSEAVINAFVESVEESLMNGEKVTLVDFGTFQVKERGARKSRNPQTKKEIEIPEKRAPIFKAGKGLKDLVNK